MVYPDTYEKKVGFDEIRTLLKGRCMSSLGTEWVDSRLALMTDYDEIRAALDRVEEFRRFMAQEDDVYEENFFDVRQALLRIRPERTYLEELDLFDLKRSLQTVLALTRFFCKGDEDDAAEYPALRRLAADVPTFPEIIARIDQTLNKYGKVKDSASAELLTIRHNIEVTTRSISHSLRSIITQAQTDGYIDRDVTPTLRDGRLVIPVAPGKNLTVISEVIAMNTLMKYSGQNVAQDFNEALMHKIKAKAKGEYVDDLLDFDNQNWSYYE